MELEGYRRPMYNKLAHSATTRSTVVGVFHKLTVDELIASIHLTCSGEVFGVQNVEITHVTLTTPMKYLNGDMV